MFWCRHLEMFSQMFFFDCEQIAYRVFDVVNAQAQRNDLKRPKISAYLLNTYTG